MGRRFKSFLLLLFIASAPIICNAQTRVTGRVVDSRTGKPLFGATVVTTSHKKSGVATDDDGHFSILIADSLPATLHINYIGYKGIDVVAASDKPLEIRLKERFQSLGEVVVIGYGSQKKGELSGSVSAVDVDNIGKSAASSFDVLLDGATSGLRVTPTSGQPGGAVSLRVRGGSSIQGGNEPLYVIDGFPIYNSSTTAGTVKGDIDNPLSSINPGDIESITILKDASATAIYGSRGANGVIIISTKHSKAGKAQVTYDGSVGVQSLRKKISVLNAKEFASLRNDALYDTDPTKGKYQYMSEDDINALGEGTNWQDAAFRSAVITNHQLTISGGNDKTQYAITGNYFKQDGIIINTNFERFSGRINLTSQVSERLNVGVNITANQTNAHIAPSGIITSLLLMPPTATIKDEDGSYTLRNPFENVFSNPIASLNEQTNKTRHFKVLGTGFGEYTIMKGLKLKVLFGIDYDNGKENNYIPSSIYEGLTYNGIASIGDIERRSWLNENTLTYSTTINSKHELDFLLGITQQETKIEISRAGSSNFVSDDLKYNSLQSGSVTTTPYSLSTKNTLISYLGRVNYNFAHKYYLTASLRSDGSSRFGKDNKWGVFPSIGGSWVITQEPFFKVADEKVSNLKLRLSYGETGNQEIGNYQSLSTLSAVTYNFGGINVKGFAPDRISNDNLGWESTRQFDVGVDAGFFADRLNVTMDYYYKKTTNLLLDVEIPWTSGFQTSLQNYGSVSNQGLEFALNSKNFVGDFSWNTNFNISFNRNKVLQIGGTSDKYVSGLYYVIQVGKPLGTFYGAKTDGILQAGEEATKGALTGSGTPKAGDRLYKDVSGDGSFTVSADRTIIGDAQPDFIFGLTNSFAYRNFDLSIFLTGSVGNDIVNINRQQLELFSGQQNADKSAVGRWTAENPSTTTPRAKLDPAPVFSDRYVEDGSYLRVKNLTLGYNFSERAVKMLGLSALRLYFSATNLLTFTSYSGFDPEVTTAENTVNQGTDQGIYPVARTFNFGIKIKF
jgi:TonB-linked SusC/RagA family outer membrane protein